MARTDLSTGKNFTINGQSPADFAKNATNQEVIAARRAVVDFLLGKAAEAMSLCGSSELKCGIIFAFDFPTGNTADWSAYFNSEGEARAFARSKLGSDAAEVEPNKWRSKDGKWQYRAKPADLLGDERGPHIHLEELDPRTGAVKQDLHLRWPEGTGRE
jgi:hypothetical protein